MEYLALEVGVGVLVLVIVGLYLIVYNAFGYD